MRRLLSFVLALALLLGWTGTEAVLSHLSPVLLLR